jgi:threonine aldolase
MFGGGMRQAGIIAAGALYAIEHHIERLADDHANAKRLALALADMPDLSIDPDTVETNIVYFEVESLPASIAKSPVAKAAIAKTPIVKAAGSVPGAPAPTPAKLLCDALKDEGVWILPVGPKRIRAVTHLDVSPDDIDQAISVLRNALTAPCTRAVC